MSADSASRSDELHRLSMCQYPGDTGGSVEFRKQLFRDVHRQGLSIHELERLLLQFRNDTVAAGSGVTRKAVTGSQSFETKSVSPLVRT